MKPPCPVSIAHVSPVLRNPHHLCSGNYVHDNGDAGLAMLESFGAEVSDNIFENNKYGVRFSVGCGRNVFSKNVITGSTKYVCASRNESRLSPRPFRRLSDINRRGSRRAFRGARLFIWRVRYLTNTPSEISA